LDGSTQRRLQRFRPQSWWRYVHTLACAARKESLTHNATQVVDPDVDAAERLAARFGGVASADEALAFGEDVDAVFVCSPTPQHAPQAIAAARSGKHIFCEKVCESVCR